MTRKGWNPNCLSSEGARGYLWFVFDLQDWCVRSRASISQRVRGCRRASPVRLTRLKLRFISSPTRRIRRRSHPHAKTLCWLGWEVWWWWCKYRSNARAYLSILVSHAWVLFLYSYNGYFQHDNMLHQWGSGIACYKRLATWVHLYQKLKLIKI